MLYTRNKESGSTNLQNKRKLSHFLFNADWAGYPDIADQRLDTVFSLVITSSPGLQYTRKKSPGQAPKQSTRGVANTVAEVCWLRNLLLELHLPLTRATLVFCDNISSIYMSSNPVHHQRTKHVVRPRKCQTRPRQSASCSISLPIC